MAFGTDGFGGSYSGLSDFDALASGPDFSTIGNRNRAARGLQGHMNAASRLRMDMAEGTLDARGRMQYAKGLAQAYKDQQRKQKGNAFGGIASGALGLGSLISAFIPGGQVVSAGLGAASGLTGRLFG